MASDPTDSKIPALPGSKANKEDLKNRDKREPHKSEKDDKVKNDTKEKAKKRGWLTFSRRKEKEKEKDKDDEDTEEIEKEKGKSKGKLSPGKRMMSVENTPEKKFFILDHISLVILITPSVLNSLILRLSIRLILKKNQ